MKVIIAGSRDGVRPCDIQFGVDQFIKIHGPITEVVSGTARGADLLGEVYAEAKGIPIKCFPADWKKYGAGAGFRRNEAMAEYADGLVAVWVGRSRGTKHMMEVAREKGLRMVVVVKQHGLDEDYVVRN